MTDYQKRCLAQTMAWADGHVFHNREDNECCPDFSCCAPDLFQKDKMKRMEYLNRVARKIWGNSMSKEDAGCMSRDGYIRCPPKQETLEQSITVVLNRFSAENGSDTPDFILAAYLTDCLTSFNRAARWREKWYSPEGVSVAERHSGPQPPYERLAASPALPSKEGQ